MICCTLCKAELMPNSHTTAQLVTAYAVRRGAVGGINGIKGELKWHEDFVHIRCLDLQKKGHRFGQLALEEAA